MATTSRSVNETYRNRLAVALLAYAIGNALA